MPAFNENDESTSYDNNHNDTNNEDITTITITKVMI